MVLHKVTHYHSKHLTRSSSKSTCGHFSTTEGRSVTSMKPWLTICPITFVFASTRLHSPRFASHIDLLLAHGNCTSLRRDIRLGCGDFLVPCWILRSS